jgi:hypothetical protein
MDAIETRQSSRAKVNRVEGECSEERNQKEFFR